MSYEPLHHKYRPQTFADLVGQEAIAQTLINAILTERIAPAYLFTGSRGTGKTSSARILAKSLNCLKQDKPTESPCGRCEVCKSITSGYAVDVIEIDAASNTGVDNIREIIERAQFAPVQCRYKVYVVDECHMLSVAAFNALLKTLEEPPKHVVFVLATTDPQRVLPTIISRCQKFDFRRIPLEAMVRHLKDIACKEKIDITADALTLVAQVAQGGLRDAESLLDQLGLLSEQITVERVWDLVGAVPERDLMELTKAIAENNSEAVLDHCRHLLDRGREPLVVLQNLASFYRDLLIAKTAPNRNDLVAVTPPTWKQLCEFARGRDISSILLSSQHLKNSEAQIKNTTQPRLWLEVTLLGLLPSALLLPASLSAQQVVRNEDRSHSGIEFKSSIRNPRQTKREDTQQPQQPSLSSAPAIDTSAGVSTTSSQVAAERSPKASPPVTVSSEQQEPTTPVPQSAVNLQHYTQETSVSAAPEMPASSSLASPSEVDTDSPDLDQVWKALLAHVQMRSTQALLSQHGQLLAFDGAVALIGMRSESLFKMIQDGLPQVEAALEKVLNHKVRVKLQVGTVRQSSQTLSAKESTSQTGSIEPTAPAGVKHSTTNYPAIEQARQVPSNSFSPAAVEEIPETRRPPEAPRTQGAIVQPQVQQDSSSGNPTTAVIELPIQPTAQIIDWDTEQVDKALDSFRKFFEGEIVELSDDLSKREPASTQPLESEKGIDDDTEWLEVELQEEQDESSLSKPAATHQWQTSELAALENTQIQKRLKTLGYDENDDIPF